MGGLILLVGFEAGGCLVAERLFAGKSRLIRLWLGLSLGLGMLMWFPSLFAFFLGFTVSAQLLGLALALVCAAAARCLPRREAALSAPREDEMPLWLPAALGPLRRN